MRTLFDIGVETDAVMSSWDGLPTLAQGRIEL